MRTAKPKRGERQQVGYRAADTFDLSHKVRAGETIIQTLLFICGVISILTTIGIVFVLGTESLRFFTSRGWINSNNRLVEVLDTSSTTLHLTVSGAPLQEGQIIRIGDEIMRVVSAPSHETIAVERGLEGSAVVEHPIDGTVFTGEAVTIGEFITGDRWQPQIGEFGIRPLLNSTLMTSAIGMIVALPLGLGAAIYLSEYASTRVRSILKPILEILAGIPTVVYGYFALTFITPSLRTFFGESVEIYNMAAAGIAIGIMIIPTVSSMSEDALSAVPRSLREASYGLGATRFETITRVLLPAAISGIIAAFILAVARAFGETMIALIAAGAGPDLVFDPFQAAETMAGHIARISTGDLSFGTIDYNSVFAVGLTLFVVSFVLNLISTFVIRRFREVYA